jgi:integrase
VLVVFARRNGYARFKFAQYLARRRPRTFRHGVGARGLRHIAALVMGELTQLRGADVVQQAIKLTPEAGTMKTRKPRTVPLHEHLVEQGFLDFVKAIGDGPLFPGNPRGVRKRLADWVRSLGVDDPELSPNHACRHTFKQVAHRAGLSEKVIDAIVGHAPASVGRAYGEPTLADKAAALAKFPRYAV